MAPTGTPVFEILATRSRAKNLTSQENKALPFR